MIPQNNTLVTMDIEFHYSNIKCDEEIIVLTES